MFSKLSKNGCNCQGSECWVSTCMCKSPADERAVEQQPAQRPAAQHTSTPAAPAAAAAPHALAFHHHTKLIHITHPTLTTIFSQNSASHDRHQPPQINYYRYEISTSTPRLRPGFAQRVLSNRLATHQREKVTIASRTYVLADALQMQPQVGNSRCY